jgi:hypothetical protein
LLKGLILLNYGHNKCCGAHINTAKHGRRLGVVDLLIGSSGVRMSFGCCPYPR